MRLDKLPVGEAIVGFLLVALVATFIVARHEVSSSDNAAADAGSPTASAAPSGSTAPGQVEITMHDNVFDHTELTLAAGADVTIPITNSGAAVHDLHIAGEGGQFSGQFCSASGPDPCSAPPRVPPGGAATLTFTVPNTPGVEISYRCDFHSNEMKGTIKVQ